MATAKRTRPYKGNNIIDFPDDFVIIDIETTGLSPYCDSIIEASAIKYIDNTEIERFSSLIRPDEALYDGKFVSEFISSLTGITHEMLADAPPAVEVFPQFRDFIGDALLVGHNISFDINFLYDNFEKYLDCYLTNDHINTVRISKKLHPEEDRHKLRDLSRRYNVDYSGAHRSLEDCLITKACFDAMKEEILDRYPDYKKFQRTFSRYYHPPVNESSQIVSEEEIDPSNPLYGKVCVFTGTLDSMSRSRAMQIVQNHGGECGSSVTRKTNYLILGDNDYCPTIKDGKSTKQKRAEQLKLEGYDIEIIPENVFLDLLEE